ncbi:MAG: cell division protein FtsA [Synergistaceae bacterium]|jgi:cell division protein FtsA|nr:cell division protein FtsA [Synergistaceae bacterium]
MLSFMKISASSAYDRGSEYLVGLDLGTSKITVVVAEREGSYGEAQIIGIGQAPSTGIRKGQIVNIDQTVKSLRRAIDDAENMVGENLSEATVAFSGANVESVRTTGMISLGKAPRSVIKFDIERVIEAAQTELSVPGGKMILHTIPVEYSLDGTRGIDDPLGMAGMRLNIELMSIIVPVAVVHNVKNCVTRAGLEVSGLVIKPLASALGTLTPEESVVGSAVVDFGGGTCGVSVFFEGRPKHLGVVSVGGEHITNDMAVVLKIPTNKAEELKKDLALFSDSPPPEQPNDLEFEYMGRNYTCPLDKLTDIVRCRVEELFSVYIKDEIAASGIASLPGGLIITGGGSKSAGIDQYLSKTVNMPVRVSPPLDSGRMPPSRNGVEYACAAGIIRYVLEKEKDPLKYIDYSFEAENIEMSNPTIPPLPRRGKSPFQHVVNLFKELF